MSLQSGSWVFEYDVVSISNPNAIVRFQAEDDRRPPGVDERDVCGLESALQGAHGHASQMRAGGLRVDGDYVLWGGEACQLLVGAGSSSRANFAMLKAFYGLRFLPSKKTKNVKK